MDAYGTMSGASVHEPNEDTTREFAAKIAVSAVPCAIYTVVAS